jgi:hypothetical protein
MVPYISQKSVVGLEPRWLRSFVVNLELLVFLEIFATGGDGGSMMSGE